MDLYKKVKGFTFIVEAAEAEVGVNIYHAEIHEKKDVHVLKMLELLEGNNIEYDTVSIKNKNYLEFKTDKKPEEIKQFFEKHEVLKDLDFKLASVENMNYPALLKQGLPKDAKSANLIYSRLMDLMEKESKKLEIKISNAVSKDNIKRVVNVKKDFVVFKKNFDEMKFNFEDLKKTKHLLAREGQDENLVIKLEPRIAVIDEKIKKMKNSFTEKIDAMTTKSVESLTNIEAVKEINELKAKLADVYIEINNIKKSGVIPEKQHRIIKDKFKRAQKRGKLSNKEITDAALDVAAANIGVKIESFNSTKHTNVDEVTRHYLPLKSELKELEKTSPKLYAKLNYGLDKIAETKVAILRSLEEVGTEIKAPEKEAEKEEFPTKVVTVGEEQRLKGNQYIHEIHLPLGQRIEIPDVDKLKVVKITRGRKEDVLLKSVFGKIGRGVDNLLAYKPEPGPAGVISMYHGVRDAAGTLLQWTTKNTIGLVAGIAGGAAGAFFGKVTAGAKAGADFGEGVGKFIKYEMVCDTGQLNPAVVEFEDWFRGKFNLEKILPPDTKKAEELVARKPPKQKHIKVLAENFSDGGVSTPNPDGGVTPGTTYQTPSQMVGVGDPYAPTKTESGSGDRFEPVRLQRPEKKKKKKKKKRESKVLLPFQMPSIKENNIPNFKTFCRENFNK